MVTVNSITMVFCVGIAMAATCITEVCTAIYDKLQPEYLPAPDRQIWETCEGGFNRQCQFPSCMGALDGKHILLQCPGAFSLMLMAVVNATYKFVYIDIGAYGSQSDGGVFKACSLGECLYNGTMDIPNYTQQQEQVLACLVSDSAFQLHRHLMKPYSSQGLNHSNRIFNYRISRARCFCYVLMYFVISKAWK